MTLDIMAIPTTRGLFALIDGEDYERLSKYKWFAVKGRNTFYAARITSYKLGGKTILMHREILGLKAGDGKQIDHINHYGLDNRKTNIRPCTHQEQQRNRLPQKNCSSKYKGVCWHKENKRWIAQIKHKERLIYLGSFNDETEAAEVYDQKAKELFGEFANCNF